MKRLLLLILLATAACSGCHTLDDMDEYGRHTEKRPEVQPSNWPNDNP